MRSIFLCVMPTVPAKTFAVSSPQRRVRMQRLERGGRAGILTNFNRQAGNLFRHLKGKSTPIAHHLFLRSCGSSVRYGRISVQVQDVSQCCVFLRPGVPAPSSTRGSSPAGCFIRYVPFLYKSHCVTAEKPFSPGKLREDAVITDLSVVRLVGPVRARLTTALLSVPNAAALLQKRRIFRNYRAQTGAGSGHILPKKPCRT